MVKTFFTSDYHLGHTNIIKYCNRPFENLESMNKTIIHNHNARVKSEDNVFFLGDFCFRNSTGGKKGEGEIFKAEYYIKKLNGRIVFIKGNHDQNNSLKTCIKGIIISIGGEDMYLTHNPEDYDKRFKINLVGHVHEKWKIKEENNGKNILVNAGVDVWDFKPITINEIFKVIEEFKREKLKGS